MFTFAAAGFKPPGEGPPRDGKTGVFDAEPTVARGVGAGCSGLDTGRVAGGEGLVAAGAGSGAVTGAGAVDGAGRGVVARWGALVGLLM
jgi:hypothetical protein